MNTIPLEEESWSVNEFGHAELGNGKRSSRLILMAEKLAKKAAGVISEIFTSPAEKQGAYKFLENKKIKAEDISKAARLATAKRCTGEKFVYVPVDQCTLSIANPRAEEDLGPTGPKGTGSGFQAMTAIIVKSDGTPLGISGQKFWTRTKDKIIKSTMAKRKLEEKETKYWFEAINQTEEVLSKEAPECRPWYQLDRGGDFRELLMWADKTKSLVTVRAAQNRKVLDDKSKLLWETMAKKPILGRYYLDVKGNSNRTARKAKLTLRASNIVLPIEKSKKKVVAKLNLTAILVQEKGTVPNGEDGIEWLLITNKPVENFKEALEVVFAYSQRWRIEEFHKCWKSICGVESIKLKFIDNIFKMAVLLSSVAMRIERLKYLGRTAPDIPASVELSQFEIDALIILMKPKGYKRGDVPSIGEAVQWIAGLGGYAGKSSGGPPGTIVIGRGLASLHAATYVVESLS